MADVRLAPPVEDDLWFVPRTHRAEQLRTDAIAIVCAAIDAAAPGPLVTAALTREPIRGGRVIIIAAGKAASAMAAAAVGVIDNADIHGVVIAPERSAVPVPGLETLQAGHPLPDASSLAAAQRVESLLADTRADDEVLVLLSGGTSALLASPAGDVTIEDYAAVTAVLLDCGADIHALNTIRRHIDSLKGGQLARLAAPARVRSLVLSDVVGDAPDTIASGPTTPDSTTYADAIAALHTAGVWAATPERVRRHLERGRDGEHAETPGPGDPLFARCSTQIIGNNQLARDGAAEHARMLGYEVVPVAAAIVGEAREAGAAFARQALELRADAGARRVALIGGGETTVTVRGTGRGGRNQELVLAAAIALAGRPDLLVASCGTDGIDGPTSVAGAVADGDSVERAGARGLEARACLDDNDAFGFFGCLHDLLLTGPTGTNVLDIQIALLESGDG